MSKPTWMYRQSGAIPVRYRNNRWEVLLITSRIKQRWIIPKGFIEPGLGALVSAAKEAWEEAGVHGNLSPLPVGAYRYPKWGGICSVEVFLLEVDDVSHSWPEMSFRKRQWVSLDDAPRRVKPGVLRDLLLQVPDYLDGRHGRTLIQPGKGPEKGIDGKKLVLLRHAKSSWDDPALNDLERPLNERGLADAPRIGKWLSSSDLTIDTVMSSPALRAAHTARLVSDEIGFSHDDIQWKPVIYDASLDQLRHVIATIDERWHQVLLIGHNPGLYELLAHLSDVHPKKFPTCGIAVLALPVHTWQAITPGCASDCQWITPRGLNG